MNKKLGHDAIYDARELGLPRMLLLGLQHLFAMFGATVLVPILVTGYGLPLSIQTTLLFDVRKNSRNSILAKRKDDNKSEDSYHTGNRSRTISYGTIRFAITVKVHGVGNKML